MGAASRLAPMSRLLLCFLLLSAHAVPSARADQDEGPSPELVARTEALLDEALASADLERIQDALTEAQAVAHAAIVRRIAAGLEDERREVQLAALQALRWNGHADALEVLHRMARDRKRMKAPEFAAGVLRAIAQHGEPSSIPVLARDPFEPDDHACRRARLFGLGRIRTRAALEAVLGILAVSESRAPELRRIRGQMDDARLVLILLTGVDQGLQPEAWEAWWRQNRKTFELPAEEPQLPRELRRQWDAFFGLPQVYEREPRREDRGR